MTTHSIELYEEFYDAVLNGIKTFEIRKADRDYKVGDTLQMTLMKNTGKVALATGRPIYEKCETQRFKAVITYILTHDMFPQGVPEGYVVMAIEVRK